MPFVYQPFQSGHAAQTIGDLLLRQGDVEAQRAQQLGAIGAQQAQQSGQIWGGLVNQLGQLPTQIQQQQDAQAQRQMRDLQLKSAQRQQTDVDALDAAFQSGGLNRDAVLGALPGHLRPTVAKQFADADKSALEVRELKDKAAVAERDYFGSLAASVKPFLGSQDGGLSAAMVALQHAKEAGYDNAGQLWEKVKADPTQLPSMVDQLIQASPKQVELINASKTADARAKSADVSAQRLELDKPKIAAETQKLVQEVEGTTPMTPAQKAQNQVAVANLGVSQGRLSEEQHHNRITEGQGAAREAREQAKYDTTYGQGVGENGQPIENPTAKSIAEYRVPAPSPRSMATGPGKVLMDQVMRLNPSYDASQFPARQKMRQAFTSGNQSQQLTALNTAIEHLGVLDSMAQALGNGSFKPGNEIYNTVRDIFGSKAVNNFEFARDVMAGELATAMKKSGATDSEIDKVTKRLSSSSSPQALAGAIREVALPMIGGKASTLDQQWKQVMGQNDPFSVYTPGAQAVLQKFGAAPHGATVGAGMVTMRAPNGQTKQVSASEVEHYKALGATVVK